VLKFVTPLNLLAYDNSKDEDPPRMAANYFGADGCAHMRAVRAYFDVDETCYDLRPTDKPTDERMGVYKILMGDFFHNDHTGPKVLIDDVYDPDVHKKGKADGQLHLKASSLLQFGIYDYVNNKGQVISKPTKYDRVMVKARLPTDQTYKYYDKCYPFIACKTTRCSSNELYIVKFRDPELLEEAYESDRAYYLNTSDDPKVKTLPISKAWPIYHKLIKSRAEYQAFTKNMLIVRICHLFLINQIPILNPMKSYILASQRDWPIDDDEMPVNYISRRMKNTNASFLSDISIMVDINENGGDLSSIFGDYDKEYQEDVQQDPNGNVPPDLPPDLDGVADELERMMGMVAVEIAGGALPPDPGKKNG